ncbi:MAG: DNA polymerase IV [Acidobacteria bacterium]|nr:DNA polymerase IV [Acidobacteriota bacterium]
MSDEVRSADGAEPEDEASRPLRRILHLDMDAFYASVEQRDRPELRGKPVAVGGDPSRRGVVAAASYEARAYGVRSAIPMSRAVALCPSLQIVKPDIARYKAVSGEVFALFREVTPLVEPLSLDEAYLDVTENSWGEPLGMNVARRLKAAIREKTGLTASAGVAPNKFLAKIASGWKKPDGLTVIAPERVEAFLQKLPVDALWGVGPVTAGRLRGIGCSRLVDLRTVDENALRKAVGSFAEALRRLSFGDDRRPVHPDRERKSVSNEHTYDDDLADAEAIRAEVLRLARRTAAYCAARGIRARTVTLKVRYGDFTTITRSHTEKPATSDADALAERAARLLGRTSAGARPVRLLGVGVHGLEGPKVRDPSAPAGERDLLPFPDLDPG